MSTTAKPPESVAINALFLDPGVTGGLETVLHALVPELVKASPKTRFVVVTTRAGEASLRAAGWSEMVELKGLPANDGQLVRRNFAEQVMLPLSARRRRWQLVHGLGGGAPIHAGAPSIVTVQDLTFFKYKTFGALTTFGLKQVVSRSARNADLVIAPSQSTREDLERMLGIDPQRTVVIPHGAGRPSGVEPTGEAELRARYALGDARVAVCVAAKRPHKNQELLVRALTMLPADVSVALIGRPEPYERQLRELADSTGVAGRAVFVDYLSDADLEGFWRLASCMTFPSRFEGFGLPVLEAMQRGVPVACSDIAVLREVGGDAALYFDPGDARQAAGQIAAALGNRALAAEGVERAKLFNWRRSAEQTLDAYERVLSTARR